MKKTIGVSNISSRTTNSISPSPLVPPPLSFPFPFPLHSLCLPFSSLYFLGGLERCPLDGVRR